MHDIKGDMVIATMEVSELEAALMKFSSVENDVKEKLLFKLAMSLFKSNKVLFTKKQDPNTYNTVYMARIFAVDNDMVQTLRDFNK